MKLSEAMYNGVEICPVQCSGDLLRYDDTGHVTQCCALGAVILGSGTTPDTLYVTFPELHESFAGTPTTIYRWIVERNDNYGWSIRQTACVLASKGY